MKCVDFNKNNDFKLSCMTFLNDLLEDIYKTTPKLSSFIHFSTNYIHTI